MFVCHVHTAAFIRTVYIVIYSTTQRAFLLLFFFSLSFMMFGCLGAVVVRLFLDWRARSKKKRKGRVTLSIRRLLKEEQGRAKRYAGGSAWLVVWNWWLLLSCAHVRKTHHIDGHTWKRKGEKKRTSPFAVFMLISYASFFRVCCLGESLWNRWYSVNRWGPLLSLYTHQGRERGTPTPYDFFIQSLVRCALITGSLLIL